MVLLIEIIRYGTMLSIRAGLVMGAGYRLAQGVTIAVRYSCVRLQGFVETSASGNRFAPERAVMDYQNQQFRVLKYLALAYAFVFTGLFSHARKRSLIVGLLLQLA